ncbi:hypothetical protein K2X30_11965 [bacterium]|jgi:hypothetical protein|nr:hypothetical protein [bacterium]
MAKAQQAGAAPAAKEEKKEAPKGQAPAGGGAPAHGPAAEGGGGKKGAKGHNPLPGACHAVACKTTPKRFNFCDEHYEQFKFGLIKKTGEPVPDYDKKIEHYQAYVAKRGAHKVA